ncbi:MAG: hypothetical protein K9M45_04735, partial [Kiritimatiellales bacterium]|nr:hypothetical protein [Kiritimatiellales bacterium]
AHIPQRDCMALALMRSAGVYQMVGYTVPTGYGYGGWGVKDYFSELQAGRFSLAEAHYANQLALVYELNKSGTGKTAAGLRNDRDVVVLYGDPAWRAQMKPRKLLWSQTLNETNGVYTCTITTTDRGDWDNRPVVQLLDERVGNVKMIAGTEYKPVVGDNFILVPLNKGLLPIKGNRSGAVSIKGDFEKGTVIEIVFKAEPLPMEKQGGRQP